MLNNLRDFCIKNSTIFIIFSCLIGSAKAYDNNKRCTKVDIDYLYSNFREYKGTKICVSGELLSETELTALLPKDRSLTMDGKRILVVSYSYAKLRSEGYITGDIIAFAGVFDFSERCFRPAIGEGRYICAPFQQRMELNDAELID